MNVLFIGNSYTYYNNMPVLFERLARENRNCLKYFQQSISLTKQIIFQTSN